MTNMTHGAIAQHSGVCGENLIEDMFARVNVTGMDYLDWVKEKRKNVLVRQFRFTNVYGTNARLDFVFVTKSGKKIGIESKHQNVGGSTDEKLPFVMLNAGKCKFDKFYCVLGGEYWTKNRPNQAIAAINKLASKKKYHFKIVKTGQLMGDIDFE